MAQDNAEADDDKPYEATQKRLDDARREGEVPSSADLTATAAYGGFIVVALAAGPQALSSAAAFLATMLDQAGPLSRALFVGGGTAFAGGVLAHTLKTSMVWFLGPAGLALVAILAQRAFVVAPTKVMPKLSRISLIDTAKQKFGRSGLFEFAKSFVKLAIYSVVLGLFLWSRLPAILATATSEPAAIVVGLLKLSVAFLGIVVAISLVLGGVDYVWQVADHARRHRMSRKELTDELKESEGDPYLKQARRQRGYDIATNRMLGEVPTADVVIVNPEHYAVALRWDRGSGRAPICVAKGVDDVARRIREAAAQAAVPIHRDPPTARALHATIGLGEEVLPEHYRPVAAAIRFAEAMRRRAGGGRR
ncbi:EscU/YscU/HrcU family type III secretion system export apparatus switch protein [Palleronia sp. KMU-117]|uniref:EscU/YscU/HrcU family type III secretion system export apparatus switch protein n=1 Tax=Palleronia sp. KMU-117 TaxID=3434108 RepID=UPI003D758FD8